jgi:hypothetical protein
MIRDMAMGWQRSKRRIIHVTEIRTFKTLSSICTVRQKVLQEMGDLRSIISLKKGISYVY